MTEETKKRLPGIIDRIDELQDEVRKMHDEEAKACKERRDTDHKVAQLFGAYIALADASMYLEKC